MIVKLSKDAWHYKLLDWTFGDVDIENLCPYFWLTVLCILISPLRLMGYIFDAISKNMKSRQRFRQPYDHSKRKAWLLSLANKTKIIIPILFFGVGAALFICLGFLIHDKWDAIVAWLVHDLLEFLLGFGLGSLVLIGFFILIKWAIEFSPVLAPVGRFFKGVFELLWYYLKAAKAGYCPKITWK